MDLSHWLPQTTGGHIEQTIGAALQDAASQWGDHLALVEGLLDDSARTWTFSQLETAAIVVARALLTEFEPGDRIAVWSTNRPEWVLLQFGVALAGMTLVTVNPAYNRQEAEFVLTHSRSVAVFVEPNVRSRDLLQVAHDVRSACPRLHSVISLNDWDQFIARAGGGPRELPLVRPVDPAQIQYTSGTTGVPKGALLAHHGLVLNGKLYATTIGANSDDVWINPMPLFHTAGCGLVTLGALQTGGTHVLPPTFDPDLVLDLFAQHRGTVFLSVPTMLIRVLQAHSQRRRDITHWRLATLGGAHVPVELVRRAETELNVSVGIGYGQTESSPYIAHTRPRDPHHQWERTVGQPLPFVEVKISDMNTGEPTAIDTSGEICTRGPCVMLGYADNPDATSQTVDQDGWLHTGDIGTLDAAGYLRIEGRLKDMIIRGGENIYPREVEDVLNRADEVQNAAVVGLPDEEWGEVVAAFIQLRPGSTITPNELENHCRQHLSSFKVPRIWEFVSEFPQTSTGKIQKFALRDAFCNLGR
ncbi:MAG: AMP-binding protein [Mycobacterium sp.]